ncbi:uncharacterized protein PAC_08463 [Phialocephala subalpina]|uniref:Peptidase C14 caspase domain-containing protein n=1 Tax=Phialocephala subalpina TaxID=576137 RepID=A0A1L7X0M0_9HELO|nr:uncharacterized protein PAC_08463 [Phialocephala subalpina]
MATPAFYTLSEQAKPVQMQDEFKAELRPIGQTHDTSRIGWHMKDLESLVKSIETAVSSSFPNHAGSRYRSVNVGMMHWEVDALGVDSELNTLRDVFKQQYGFNVETWHIPATEKSHHKLTQNTLDFIEEFDSKDNLFILYYAGHGYINEYRQSAWACSRDPDSPTVDWSHIQGLFERSKSDVVVFLDCCAAASSAPRRGNARMETLVACGFETRAPPPGEHSFTNTLIEVLGDWQNVPSFSITMLHSEVLRVLMQRRKERCPNGQRLEWRSTPVHISNSTDPKAVSIELCKRSLVDLTGFSSNPPTGLSEATLPHNGAFSSTTYQDLMSLCCDDLDQRPQSNTATPSLGRSGSDTEDVEMSPESPPDSPEATSSLKVPHMLVSFALDQTEPLPNEEACRRWLSVFPGLAKHVKVEAVFDSYSTVLIMSIPVAIWNMLPDHPACQPIAYVTSRNLMEDSRAQNEVSGIDIKQDAMERQATCATPPSPASDASDPVISVPEAVETLVKSAFDPTHTCNVATYSEHEDRASGSSLVTSNRSKVAPDPSSLLHGLRDFAPSTSVQGKRGWKDNQETRTHSLAAKKLRTHSHRSSGIGELTLSLEITADHSHDTPVKEDFENLELNSLPRADQSTFPTSPEQSQETIGLGRSQYNVGDLAAFATELEIATHNAFPNSKPSHGKYFSVHVLILTWEEDDDSDPIREVQKLSRLFSDDYGYNITSFKIPSINAERPLKRHIIEFADHDDQNSLLIVFYAGHGYTADNGQGKWSSLRNPRSHSLTAQSFYDIFGEMSADVLFIIDCCVSSANVGSLDEMREGRVDTSTVELVAASGHESTLSADSGDQSFTSLLTEVLEEWKSRAFSVVMLHSEILSRTSSHRPHRQRPIYASGSKSSLSSIQLGQIRRQRTSGIHGIGSNSAPTLAMDLSLEALGDDPSDGGLQVPRVLISINLEENQTLDSSAAARWLESMPTLAKKVKIEQVYESF